MKNYYFTYGTEGQPFRGGWTQIQAETEEQARTMFRAIHPDKIPGILNCSSVYDEEYFTHSKMYRAGNFGARCHEIVIVRRGELNRICETCANLGQSCTGTADPVWTGCVYRKAK